MVYRGGMSDGDENVMIEEEKRVAAIKAVIK